MCYSTGINLETKVEGSRTQQSDAFAQEPDLLNDDPAKNTEHLTPDYLLDDPAIISINKNLDKIQFGVVPLVNKVLKNDVLPDDPAIICKGTNLNNIKFGIVPQVDKVLKDVSLDDPAIICIVTNLYHINFEIVARNDDGRYNIFHTESY